ncbi:hypothetical protein M427DRAFT_221716 [Gonapodya prolifera JEL478]|uniref:Uncharacterized protein n=1 Tax=Gonapodya prolifera (strain JEL478) TaxID=1344416 RepID=A0A139AMU4_GONPJ|nr:hypothetical protein M427DRAFT_221716 [Gonapodya prolifera JEL478]|eukprot:KXS18086.1 hypothetical protein M427DRAFT_221716 [Gonapodya prolifera JEL478]
MCGKSGLDGVARDMSFFSTNHHNGCALFPPCTPSHHSICATIKEQLPHLAVTYSPALRLIHSPCDKSIRLASQMSTSQFGTTASGHPMTNGIPPASNTTPSEPQKIAKVFGVSLRVGIIALVIVNVATVAIALSLISYFESTRSNADAVAQGSSNIMALATARQRDASQMVLTQMDNSLNKIYALTNATASSIQMGLIDIGDFDKLGPHMAVNLRAIIPPIRYHMVFNNKSQESTGAGFLYDNSSSLEPTNYYYLYMAANKTCQTYCPVVSTGDATCSIGEGDLPKVVLTEVALLHRYPFHELVAHSNRERYISTRGFELSDSSWTPIVEAPLVRTHRQCSGWDGVDFGSYDEHFSIRDCSCSSVHQLSHMGFDKSVCGWRNRLIHP